MPYKQYYAYACQRTFEQNTRTHERALLADFNGFAGDFIVNNL